MAHRVRTIAQATSIELEVKRSRFICSLERAPSEEAARDRINDVRKRYWDASHHCSAWVIGETGQHQRSSDDGEPAGTAGVPMLTVLNQHALTDTVAVVTRYFGGTLLGAGGLIRAYGQSVSNAIAAAGVVERQRRDIVIVTVSHDRAGKFDFALRGSPWTVIDIEYEAKVTFSLSVDPQNAATFDAWLAHATNGEGLAVRIGQQIIEAPLGKDG